MRTRTPYFLPTSHASKSAYFRNGLRDGSDSPSSRPRRDLRGHRVLGKAAHRCASAFPWVCPSRHLPECHRASPFCRGYDLPAAPHDPQAFHAERGRPACSSNGTQRLPRRRGQQRDDCTHGQGRGTNAAHRPCGRAWCLGRQDSFHPAIPRHDPAGDSPGSRGPVRT